MKELDRKINHSTSGGHLADIPLPHIRYWPGADRKRRLTIGISRFYGVGEHYYLRIVQEKNPIWNSQEGYWHTAWDDEDGNGTTETQLYFDGKISKTKFSSYAEITGYAKWVAKTHFPDHEIVWEDFCKDFDNIEALK